VQQDLAIFLKKYFAETNVCECQEGCTLGCIPGARHTVIFFFQSYNSTIQTRYHDGNDD
jgi:hypothetical protein